MFNPLSNYLSKHGVAVSDWGIEEASTTLSTPSYFRHDTDARPAYPPDFLHYYQQHFSLPLLPSTDNFAKYIRHYLSVHRVSGEFWEKFKYLLVTSSLLEDSLILSKTEQALATLTETADLRRRWPSHMSNFNFDGTTLDIYKSYTLKYSPIYNQSKYILIVINLVIFLLKQVHNQAFPRQHTVKMFKVLLLVSTKIIKHRRINLYIKTNQNIAALNTFLHTNHNINKRLILNLITLKELQVYNFLGNSIDNDKAVRYKAQLTNILIHTLGFLNLGFRAAITALVPHMNGPMIEQYCTINNINLSVLNVDYTPNEDADNANIDEIVFYINQFNQLRKLFICQLLTINDAPPQQTYFIYKLADTFEMDAAFKEYPLKSLPKLDLLRDGFTQLNLTVDSFNKLFETFERNHKLDSLQTNHDNQDVLKINTKYMAEDHDSSLTPLIAKLSNLTTNLKFFDKYNQSTKAITNIDEINEKLMIFNQFAEDLANIKELYQLNHNELYQLTQEGPDSPTSTSSMKSSSSNDRTFGLKSFHNSSIKKRYSGPSTLKSPRSVSSPTFGGPLSSPKESFDTISSGKKYKRLSGGLQLGLLTVVEEPKDKTHSRNSSSSSSANRISNGGNGTVAFDENYLNILPPSNYDTYNQVTLDQLSNGVNGRRLNLRNNANNPNRFSLTSVNSNISGLTDLISSTHITSFDEEEGLKGSQISKEELKIKLEESFSRIYSLENENKILKQPQQLHTEQHQQQQHAEQHLLNQHQHHQESTGFISELESALSNKLS